MNDSQNKKYWRRWAFVCRQNNWRWIKGRLVDNAVKDAGIHHTAVWQLAEKLAEQGCRAVEADDLRHACHIHALGRDVGHVSFSNDQFNRLLLLWGNEREIRGLLVYPDDIRAQTFWDNPEMQKKEGLVRSILACAADEYVAKISSDIFGTIYWQDLDATALLGLLRKVKGNAPAMAGQPF